MSQPLLHELERRWRDIFTTLAAGEDAPPGARLRAEGMMEALVLTGEFTQPDVLARMEDIYRDVFGHSIEQEFGADWVQFYPFPQIPAVGRRAPVYPSTRD